MCISISSTFGIKLAKDDRISLRLLGRRKSYSTAAEQVTQLLISGLLLVWLHSVSTPTATLFLFSFCKALPLSTNRAHKRKTWFSAILHHCLSILVHRFDYFFATY
jgi:hypothetical protein